MLILLTYSSYMLFSYDIVGIKQMMPIIKDIRLLFSFFLTAMVLFSLSIMKLQKPLVNFLF